MINWKTIHKIIGALLGIETMLMMLCAAVAFYYGEDDTIAFVITIVLTMLSAIVLEYKGRKSDNSMSRKDSFLVVSLTWVIFSFFGMLPFLISGYIPNITDAYFETMSGFTTTGATILDDTMDRRIGNSVLYYSHSSIVCWRIGKGICCRGNRSYAKSSAPAPIN